MRIYERKSPEAIPTAAIAQDGLSRRRSGLRVNLALSSGIWRRRIVGGMLGSGRPPDAGPWGPSTVVDRSLRKPGTRRLRSWGFWILRRYLWARRSAWLTVCFAVLAWIAPVALVSAEAGRYGWWLPKNVSTNGATIDRIFYLILIITGIVFVLVQGTLIVFAVKYRARPGGRAVYTHGNNRLEVVWTIIPAIFLAGLALYNQKIWVDIRPNAGYRGTEVLSGDPVVIEVVAQQFAWNIRYPGADGEFGRRVASLVSATNPVGLDPNDLAAADDIVTLNQFHIPVGRQIQVRLTSKDVLHSFFLPDFRVKQDAVPGMQINVLFDALEVGDFEIACAELCGMQHYQMRGFVHVHEPSAFDSWLAENAPAHQD